MCSPIGDGAAALVLVDLLGFGQSPKPAIAYTLDDHLMALHATLTGLGIARAHLVGHSMGGLVSRSSVTDPGTPFRTGCSLSSIDPTHGVSFRLGASASEFTRGASLPVVK